MRAGCLLHHPAPSNRYEEKDKGFRVKPSFLGMRLDCEQIHSCISRCPPNTPEAFRWQDSRRFLVKPIVSQKPFYLKYKHIESITVICKLCLALKKQMTQ